MECLSRMFLVIALMLMIATNADANLVVNGGFEAGDFSGWTFTPATTGSMAGVDDVVPRSGVFGAYFGATDRIDDSISQTIPTVPGSPYTFEFWLSNGDILQDNDFHAYWNGVSVLDLVDVVDFPYTRYAFTVFAPGASTTIGFSGANAGEFYNLDDIRVDPVPEPSTVFLLGVGLVGAGLAGRRFRQSLPRGR